MNKIQQWPSELHSNKNIFCLSYLVLLCINAYLRTFYFYEKLLLLEIYMHSSSRVFVIPSIQILDGYGISYFEIHYGCLNNAHYAKPTQHKLFLLNYVTDRYKFL